MPCARRCSTRSPRPCEKVFVFAHASSTRFDSLIDGWEVHPRTGPGSGEAAAAADGAAGERRHASDFYGANDAAASEHAAATAAVLDEPEVAAALRALAPAAVRTFNASEYIAAMRGESVGPCFERPPPPRNDVIKLSKGDMRCCHFSHRGPELWGVGQCFAMIEAREVELGRAFAAATAAASTASSDGGPAPPLAVAGGKPPPPPQRFRWYVQMRPDYLPLGAILGPFLQAHVVPEDGAAHRVWLRRAPFSDAIYISTRAAAAALTSVWTELRLTSCLALPQNSLRRLKVCQQLMGSSIVTWTSECLVALHLRRLGVQILTWTELGPGKFLKPLPPATATTGGARRRLLSLFSAPRNSSGGGGATATTTARRRLRR